MMSVDPAIAPLVASATTTANKAWNRLVTTYANRSQSRIYSLQEKLSSLTKHTKTIAKYLGEICSISDELSLASSPLGEAELMIKILNAKHSSPITIQHSHKDNQNGQHSNSSRSSMKGRGTLEGRRSQHTSHGYNSTVGRKNVGAIRISMLLIQITPEFSVNYVISSSQAEIIKVYEALSMKFSLKDLTSLSYFLGVEVSKTSNGLHLSQKKYITDLLQEFKMIDAKGVKTPLPLTATLQLNNGTSSTDATQYRKLIGSFQYLSFTRPDLAFAVN
ncbi:hypothetical protein GH714_013302 [Hevea brasiliensis]|uniref:Reverse transcriptase Ty1/copia-type domain-containing protein n=1 Tax=Hevea brasiliensis TaxID=3981 RepID=A0A6A6KQW9_HEVBR|nr:hypothetical protein GH714_013302 [Hevea brasiliensis]